MSKTSIHMITKKSISVQWKPASIMTESETKCREGIEQFP